MKKFTLIFPFLILIICCSGCSFGESEDGNDNRFSVGMVTDTGGVNDQSFNMSSWQGISNFAKKTNSKASYIESKQSSDYFVNIDRLADEKLNLIWGIGFSLADVIEWAAKTNPELNYAIVDYSYGDNTLDNVTGVVFRAEESAFLVGYIAGMSTKTGKVGFVGGISGIVIDQFEYGYRAGVEYAAKERGMNFQTKIQYAESFSDAAKGKAIALKMFSEGCDIVFHAAGGVGVGVIEAAKESDNYAIGVDMDQSYLAPQNVLTSALKNVGQAVEIVSTAVMEGNRIGGGTLSFGIKESCVGIPDSNPNLDPKIYLSAMKIKEKISNEEITPPFNKEKFEEFRSQYIK